MIKILSFILALALGTAPDGFVFDKMVHDWGDVCVSDGPLSCAFTITNNSQEALTILSVVSSCGCTDVKWTKETIAPGASGKVEATYKNQDGPMPFDKTLTVYLSGQKKPTVLHLRGVVHEKQLPLDQSFPVHYGPLALRASDIKVGNLSQGEQKSGEIMVANIGAKPITVSFKDLAPGLAVRCNPATIPAGGTAHLEFTVTSSRERWGKNWYYATPLVDGKAYKCTGTPAAEESAPGAETLHTDYNPALAEGCSIIGFWAITKENFSMLSKEERRDGSLPKFDASTFEFGKIKAGTAVEASFTLNNTGKKDLVVYKADCESLRITAPASIAKVAPGGKTTISFKLDTAGLPKGEQLFLITLYTNSPIRPIVNLYINGNIL